MKKIISICLLGIVAGLSFPSCSQDLLEIEQKGVLSVDAVYGGADDETILNAIRKTIWNKPLEHHFESKTMPATRGMYRIGG